MRSRVDRKAEKTYDITNLHRYYEPVGDEERTYVAIGCRTLKELIRELQALEDQAQPKLTNTMVPESKAHQPPYTVDQEPEK